MRSEEAISLEAAIHMLRVLAEPNRVVGYRAADSLSVVVDELERLRAVEERAREVSESTVWLGEPAGAALYILGETS